MKDVPHGYEKRYIFPIDVKRTRIEMHVKTY
jgi:hypothetical protein